MSDTDDTNNDRGRVIFGSPLLVTNWIERNALKLDQGALGDIKSRISHVFFKFSSR